MRGWLGFILIFLLGMFLGPAIWGVIKGNRA